mgnify:CR=1 FL=1
MNVKLKGSFNLIKLIAIGCLATAILIGCTADSSDESSPIQIDGSSTVYPITKKIVETYQGSTQEQIDITVDFSGTGGGFRKFCQGETDINNASRPIQVEEMKACNQGKIRYIELPIAFDAITVVVNPQNDWLDSITIEELKTIWSPKAEEKITRWNQFRADLPNQPLNLYAPGADSGTFDYFTEAVVGKAGASRSDYLKSEDDEILVQGVSQDPNALGYFGLAYYEQHSTDMKAVAIDSVSGAVLPSRETVEQAQYQPLARPLFIYINAASAQKNPALVQFIEFYLNKVAEIVPEVGYIPLPEEAYHIDEVTFHKGEVGTVFEGKSQFNLTIPELLRQQAQF